jgi:hypothetical protein
MITIRTSAKTKLITLTGMLLVCLHPLMGADTPKPDPVAPPTVTPGKHGAPPSDAIVLFDGSSLEAWQSQDGPAKWTLLESASAMEVAKGAGSLRTKASFGDVQLHIEWASPSEVKGSGQGRGNSGVYLQGRYEIQVLDSFNNETYFNGQAGSFYGHAAPLVNASRPPGQWQSYDIVFIAPKSAPDGTVKAGSFTVFHNGVLIQNQTPIPGGSTTAADFSGIAPKGPLVLQDHGNPVRYRNIWIRELN